MSRDQQQAPYDGQVRNQYEIWFHNFMDNTWHPSEPTFNEYESAQEELRFFVGHGFTVRLATVQYSITKVE